MGSDGKITPPTLNLENPNVAAEVVDVAGEQARPMQMEHALSNGFGLGRQRQRLISAHGLRPIMHNLTRPVLIPIDMQCAFDLPGRPRRWNVDLDRNGLALLEAWRVRRLPIIHVRNDSIDAASFFHPAHAGHAWRPGFEPQDEEEFFSKPVNSAFIGTDLDLRLRRLKPDAIVLFGMRTDMCVSSTARSGANIGWRVIVVADASDCCDLPDPFGSGIIAAEDAQRVHLATLAAEYAEVITTKAAIAMVCTEGTTA